MTRKLLLPSKLMLSSLLILALAGCGDDPDADAPPYMAVRGYNCSVSQGFYFQEDKQVLVGFVNSLKIGNETLTADFHVTDPENVANTIRVFGVLLNIYWEGAYADPIQFSAQVSTENRGTLATMIHTGIDNPEVSFEFTVYDYDPKDKKYYKAFHTNDTALNGLISGGGGGELAMNIDTMPSTEVVIPQNFTFSLVVMPTDEQQEIHISVSASEKFVKQWGMEVGG